MPISTISTTDSLDTHRTTFNTTVARWNNLGTYDAIVITGGNVNGTVIGNTVPSSGTFSSLTVNTTTNLSSSTLILSNNQISGDKISGGTIDTVIVELSNTTPTLSNHAASKSYVDTKSTFSLDEAARLLFFLG